MGSRGFETDIVENWNLGVVSSPLPDRLADGAVPAVVNGQFYNIGPSMTVFGTRYGCEVQNDEAHDSSFVSQYFLNTTTGDFHLLVDEDGNLLVYDELTPFDEIGTATFTETDDKFSWQTFNDHAFVVNGTDALKTDGAGVSNFGIEQPDDSEWSVTVVGGGSNLQAGDYNLVISYFNSTTNHEGPQSEVKSVTTTAGQQIRVQLPDATEIGDDQVDFVKIYIEQEGVRNDFFLVVDGTSPAITGTSGWAPNTLVDIDIPQASLDVFTVLSPGVNNHFPPPTGAKFIANHLSRMFAAEGNNLYWSKVGFPEAFNVIDDSLPIGETDGEDITGIAEIGEALVVFKRNKIYALVGSTPESWEIILVDKTVGCVGSDTIANVNNQLMFMSLRGPQLMNSAAGVNDITTQLVGNLFDESAVDPNELENSVAVPHPLQNYVAWAITPIDATANTTMIPFDFKLQRWMSSAWEMVDVQSCTVITDEDGRDWPMVADYDGFLYKVGETTSDGVPDGAVATGVATGLTSTVLTFADAAWTADELIGRYVYVWSPALGVRNAQRRKITANTTDTLTFAALGSIPQDARFSIGGILFDWKSAVRNGGGPFNKKRIEFAFLELASNSSGVSADVEIYRNSGQDDPIMERTVSIGDAAVFGVAIFGVDRFAEEGIEIFRLPIRTVGYSWQTRIIHLSQGEQLYVRRNAVQWQTKTKKTARGFGG